MSSQVRGSRQEAEAGAGKKGRLGCANLKEGMATHSSILRENPWTDEPGGLQSMGSKRVGHD